VNSPEVSVALGFLGLVVALLFFPPLFARLAGWPELAMRFGPAPATPLTRIGYATLGTLSTAPVKLSASEQGLVVSQVFTPFRFVPPLLIPWNGVREEPSRVTFLVVTFSLPPERKPLLFLKPHVARRLRPWLLSPPGPAAHSAFSRPGGTPS
jgi:hypothetical protein